MIHLRAIFILAMIALANEARGQAIVPFVQPGAALFAPQISIVNSGTLNDVQGTVSADRKYVTVNARPQIANVIKFETFNFQAIGQVGLVGGNPNPAPAPGAPPVNPAPNPVKGGAAKIAPGVLGRTGMTRLE